MKDKKEEKCPYCGCTETVIGKQANYAAVERETGLNWSSEVLKHIICLNCGTVIRSYVENPKKLLPKEKIKINFNNK